MRTDVKLAFYKKVDWNKLIGSVSDKAAMHDSWEEWHKDYTKTKKELTNLGIVVHEVTIDIDDLNLYCRKLGIKNDGRARSRYTAQLPITKS